MSREPIYIPFTDRLLTSSDDGSSTRIHVLSPDSASLDLGEVIGVELSAADPDEQVTIERQWWSHDGETWESEERCS